MPAFTRYIGIDYSGAETPTASLSCKPRLNRQWRIGNLQQLFAEILSGEKTHEGCAVHSQDRRRYPPFAPVWLPAAIDQGLR